MEARVWDTVTSRELGAGLEALRAGVRHGRIAVCLWQAERGIAFASTDHDSPAGLRLPCGCLTKLFTGALLEQAVSDGLLDLDARLGDCLPAARRAVTLASTTLRELLEHRHGLDDSVLPAVPRRVSGAIDSARLIDSLDARLFEPGTLYSYSNAGAWLCAALLEALHGQPYAALLNAWGTSHGVDLHAPRGGVCPALGGRLSISVAGLIVFAQRLATVGAPCNGAASAPLPGWHPLELGIERGLKRYGRGWLGHQSVAPRASAWLCAHPGRRTAVVIESGRYSAAVVGLRLLARRVPGFVPTLPPKAAGRGPCTASPPSGRFASRAQGLTVSSAEPGSAVLRCGTHTAALRGSRHGIFDLDPPHPRIPFVQFVHAADGTGPYLWNGRQILPRNAE